MAPLSPYNYCLYLLSKRDFSQFDIVQKLKKREVETDEIDRCLQKLLDNNLQSDKRFCESMLRYYSGQLKGPIYIKHKLNQSGVNQADIELAFIEADVVWFEVLERLILKKYGKQTDVLDWQEKQKRQRYLFGRGFSFDLIAEFF